MGGSPKHMTDRLAVCFIAVCLFLTLFILTWVGVGDTTIVSMLGLLLCAVGFAQGNARVDLWVLVPLILFNLLSMASSYASYGNVTEGYASTQMIYPVIYLILSYADEKQMYALRRLCTLWAAAAAAAGLGQFTYEAIIRGGAGRLDGFLGNPNAMGIFLVLGYFVLSGCMEEQEKDRLGAFLFCMEPVLLAALALTLSMGSFLALAVGMVLLFAEKMRRAGFSEMISYARCVLAKAVLGVGTGLLLYLGGTRTRGAWVCLILLLYLAALAVCWRRLDAFLKEYGGMAAGIALSGVLVAAAVIVIRPSSYATFAERLEMMGSGLHYITVKPLLGVGPYRWRMLDMNDGGTYFNTWHIHNVLIHVGVELGLPAMVLLAAVAVRFVCKKKSAAQKAGFAAFFAHNMMDTGFFYLGITCLALLAGGEPRERGKTVQGGVMRALFGGFAVFFAYNLYDTVR
ncbi:MAG: hypothetical protein NC541_10095 [bacterium]|nr:hypothetical protein [bacterium]